MIPAWIKFYPLYWWVAFGHWLQKTAYPMFDCENCLGLPEYGCYCYISGASAPGVGPTYKQRVAKKILKVMRGKKINW
jgi:hypothetical protein